MPDFGRIKDEVFFLPDSAHVILCRHTVGDCHKMRIVFQELQERSDITALVIDFPDSPVDAMVAAQFFIPHPKLQRVIVRGSTDLHVALYAFVAGTPFEDKLEVLFLSERVPEVIGCRDAEA